MDLHLVDARELHFNRIFQRRDVEVGSVESVQTAVQRPGFARTRGAGHQQHAFACVQRVVQACQFVGFVTQSVKLGRCLFDAQHTQHQLFAVQRGQ